MVVGIYRYNDTVSVYERIGMFDGGVWVEDARNLEAAVYPSLDIIPTEKAVMERFDGIDVASLMFDTRDSAPETIDSETA